MAIDEKIRCSAKHAEDPAPPVRTVEQSKAGPRAEKVPVDPMPESLVARRPAEEPTATTSGLGGGERLADRSATVSKVMAETARSLGAEARAVDVVPAFSAVGPAAPME